jgi:hypothetical protein
VVGEAMISRDRYHRVDVDVDVDAEVEAVACPQSADEEKVSAEPVADSDAAPTGADGETATATADAADNPQPDAADEQQGRGLQVYGDSAYGTGEARAAYRAAGHDTVIKPKPLRPAVPGGFTLDDFTVDETAGAVTCPAGHSRPMSPKRTVTFGRVCGGCPLRSRCTTAQDGRSMTIHPHEELLRAARAQARTPQFKQDYPTRSAIERIIAWAATQNGRRLKLRYLGVRKNDAWLRTRCASLNLRTLVNSGLTRENGVWALA